MPARIWPFNKRDRASESAAAKVVDGISSEIQRFVDQYNEQAHDPALSFVIDKQITNSAKGTTRTVISNTLWCLSFLLEGAAITAHIFRNADLLKSHNPETARNMKLNLSVMERSGTIELSADGEVIANADLPLILLSLFEELVRKSHTTERYAGRISLDNKSIATAVRSLLHERNSLLKELLLQNEQIQNAIAREIHDQVISDLLLLRRKQADANVSEDQTGVVDDCIISLRDICSGLSTRDLRDWGLLPCLNELLKRSRRKADVDIELLLVEDPPDYPFEVNLQIFRIIQESLNNALKHSNCSLVQIKLAPAAAHYEFSVEDNGGGINRHVDESDAASSGGGQGLHIMTERAALIDFQFPARLIVSTTSSGTSVRLEVNKP